jgi:hypothetical protein
MASKFTLLAATAAFVIATIATAALSPVRANNLIVDGQFNVAPIPNSGDQYYLNDGSTLPGGSWTVLDNNVDVVAPGASPYAMNTPTGSCCSVDLVGYGSTGGVYQSFTPSVSSLYTLSFFYANNSYSTSTASANVEVGTSGGGSSDVLLQNITHNTSTAPSAMDWTFFSDVLSLNALTAYTLSFDTTYGNNSGGVVITDVSVSTGGNAFVTPLPAAFPLFAGGLGMIGLLGARRRRTVQAA